MKQIFLVLALSLSLGVADGFAFSQATSDDTVANALELQPSVKVLSAGVEIDNPTDEPVDVAVYAITGASVKATRLEPSAKERIDLPAGCYIVKVGKLSKRIAVR